MAIILLLVFLTLFGNLQATHCDKELHYDLNYGYEITCEELSNESENLLKDITISKELVLNINNSSLTKVTSDLFGNVSHIKFLSITNSTFVADRNQQIFASLTQLQHLKIENTRFNLDSNVVQGLDNLKELNLINCSLTNIQHDSFKVFKRLERLKLSKNYFESILDIPFCDLPAIKYVDLDHNEIQRIEDDFFLCLENHTESAILLNGEDYRVRYNTSNFFSQAKTNLNVIELNLSHNNITQIASLEWALTLKNLDLSNNKLKEINNNLFGKALLLEKLNLENNLLEKIDSKSFLGLKNLKIINLENNTISGVYLQYLPFLEEVHLSKNKLVSNSLTHLSNLPKLLKLFLKDNEIQQLPPNIFDSFVSLEFLDLSNNRIVLSHLPFKNLTNLKQLNIRNNSLRIIPVSTFHNLTSLEFLDISENAIETFSDLDTFVGLENLQILNMSQNLIEDLSYDLLSPLRGLQVLDISGNRLQNFHVSLISMLPSLRVINIRSNLLPCSILATIISFLKTKGISFTIHENFEYDRQNVDGIYCEEMSNRFHPEKEDNEIRISSALGILFLVVVCCVLVAFVVYRCILYSKRRYYRMDEMELL